MAGSAMTSSTNSPSKSQKTAPRAPLVRSTREPSMRRKGTTRLYREGASGSKRRVDKRAAVVLAVIFGGLFLVLFGFMLLAYSAVKSTSFTSDVESSAGARVGL